MMDRNRALLKLSYVQFTLFEIHLYLDTHPGDKQAAEKYDRLSKEYAVLKNEFEMKYGPLTQRGSGVQWLKDPWPWENTEECDY